MISGGVADSLTKMPKALVNHTNGKPPPNTKNDVSKENGGVQNPLSGTSVENTLQDIETDIDNQKLASQENEVKTNIVQKLPNETAIIPNNGKDNEKFDAKSKQSSSMPIDNLKNDVIIEEVNEEVLRENTRPSKKVTFPDEDSPPRGLEKREHTILPSGETKPVAVETKAASNPAENEVIANFGKEKTGMNSRKPSSNGTISTGGEKSNDEMFGKNVIVGTQFEEHPHSLGPRDHTLTDIII